MIYLKDIYIKYGDRVLLDHINLMLKKGERIGLIGRNGAGKSTLLRVIAGIHKPDNGEIAMPSGSTTGYLQQEIDFTINRSILEETMECFTELKKIENELHELNMELESRQDYESDDYMLLLEKLSVFTDRLSYLDSANQEGNTVKVLKGLGFEESQLHHPVSTLSGGWKMRIELAKLLLTAPDLLLLDEPTNHLDIESIMWVEQYLTNYPGTVIIISHDIQFLDNTVNRVIEIELGKPIDIKGNYSHFTIEKEKQREVLESAFANQQKVIEQKERTIKRFMAKATKTTMAQSMQKQLDKMERIAIPDTDNSEMKIKFSEVPRAARVIAKIENLYKSYGEKEVIRNCNLVLERGDKIAFVGQNGQGKSTLAKILTGRLPFDSGTLERGDNTFLTFYAQDETDQLDRSMTVLEVAEEAAPPDKKHRVRHILGAFMFSGEDAEKKVSVLSGGEKSRLSLACKIMHPANLIILDEPTNHLDIRAKNILKQALIHYDGALIVVSHDRHFLAGLTDKVYEFRDHQVREYLGDINYFLDKRKMDSMREVEMSTTSQSGDNKDSNPSNQNRDSKKQLHRKVQYLEKEIHNIEEELKKLRHSLAVTSDYASEDYIRTSKKFSQLEQELNSKMHIWENLVSEIETMA